MNRGTNPHAFVYTYTCRGHANANTKADVWMFSDNSLSFAIATRTTALQTNKHTCKKQAHMSDTSPIGHKLEWLHEKQGEEPTMTTQYFGIVIEFY